MGIWLRYRDVQSPTRESSTVARKAMRPAVKLLFLWLILTSVSLGGLRQATSSSWSRTAEETLVSLSRSCSSDDPHRQHAPTLCLLKYCCASSSSSDEEFDSQKLIFAAWRVFQFPFCDGRPGCHSERRSARSIPAAQNSPWSTGPPARC